MIDCLRRMNSSFITSRPGSSLLSENDLACKIIIKICEVVFGMIYTRAFKEKEGATPTSFDEFNSF